MPLTITRAWVVSIPAGTDGSKHPDVPQSHSPSQSISDAESFPSMVWSCQATFVVSLNGPPHTVPWQLWLWRKGFVVKCKITFPLSSYLMRWKMNHSEYDRSNPGFGCSGVNLVQNCLWGINSLLDAKDWSCIPGTHIQNTVNVPAPYALEKAARTGQITVKIIGK